MRDRDENKKQSGVFPDTRGNQSRRSIFSRNRSGTNNPSSLSKANSEYIKNQCASNYQTDEKQSASFRDSLSKYSKPESQSNQKPINYSWASTLQKDSKIGKLSRGKIDQSLRPQSQSNQKPINYSWASTLQKESKFGKQSRGKIDHPLRPQYQSNQRQITCSGPNQTGFKILNNNQGQTDGCYSSGYSNDPSKELTTMQKTKNMSNSVYSFGDSGYMYRPPTQNKQDKNRIQKKKQSKIMRQHLPPLLPVQRPSEIITKVTFQNSGTAFVVKSDGRSSSVQKLNFKNSNARIGNKNNVTLTTHTFIQQKTRNNSQNNLYRRNSHSNLYHSSGISRSKNNHSTHSKQSNKNKSYSSGYLPMNMVTND